ncbi:ATP-binding protein [Actinomarinicola tropica]|uniref:Anti-sigma factor n=1 Tax=Actinomarinicola tropica TaxID=2789776 RepID=A0A5Q2RJ98_9ACTN|nr:hypothetical protein [Actinomarinicola tropica]QGG95584.1 hypothetical protein GH723_11025 [Actinomarinicola tropica]
MSATPLFDRPIACVTLELDPDPELLRLARLVVSGVASITPMGLDEVEDCRAAIDELCSTLLEVGRADATMCLELRTDGRSIHAEGEMSTESEPAIDEVRRELSEMILSAVTDRHELDISGGRGRFSFDRSPVASRG